MQLFFLAALALVAYAPSLTIPLIADDYPNLSQSLTYGAPGGLGRLVHLHFHLSGPELHEWRYINRHARLQNKGCKGKMHSDGDPLVAGNDARGAIEMRLWLNCGQRLISNEFR